jgi:hypothetical protein
MPQLCPQCQKENPSSANFCMYCQTSLVDNHEMTTIDRLNKELNEAKDTNKLLKKALTEAQKNNNQEELAILQAKLAKEVQSRKALETSLGSKDKEIAELKTTLKKKKSNSAWVFFLITTLALAGAAYYFYDKNETSQSRIEYLTKENNGLSEKFQGTDVELKKVQDEAQSGKIAQQKLSEISTYCPIVIKSLKIGNISKDNSIETDYGKTLYGSSTMYLSPQIEYIGLAINQSITLSIKLYKNGELNRNESISPTGYTFESSINVSESGKSVLGGWGSDTKGNWSSGNYRYEIWYGSSCLKAVDFYIY